MSSRQWAIERIPDVNYFNNGENDVGARMRVS